MRQVITSSSTALSKKAEQCWEQVLQNYCEFGVEQDYRELDKDGQKKMLAALDSSVRNFMLQIQMQSSGTTLQFATASRPSQRKKGGKKTRPHSQDLLQAALLESGYSPDFFEGAGCAGMAELLETVKVEFLGTWGVPPALDSLLAKHEMLHVHRLAEAACKGGIRTSDSTVQKASMDSSWENLRPVSISELKLFQTMKGRRLNCQVVGSPNHSVGITTILQDSAGTVVVAGIYNLPGVSDQSSANQILPKGCTVIIAEPFLKIMTYGERGIRVDNPAEIQIFLPGVKPLPELHRSIAAGGYGASGTSSSAAKTPQRDAKISRDLFEDPYVPGKRVRLIGLTSKKGLRLNGKFGVVAAQQDEMDLERITVQVDSDAGNPDSLKVRPSNLEIVPDASLEDILRSKAEANEAFSKGDLETAIEGYSQVVAQLSCNNTPSAVMELTKCLCNRALCFLKLGKWDSAMTDSHAVLEREPANVKAHFRLASALFKGGHVEDQEAVNKVALHASIATALAKKIGTVDAPTLELFNAIGSKSARPVATADEVISVKTPSELESALSLDEIKVIVLCPGTYMCSPLGMFLVTRDITMVGLGQVTFLKDWAHVISVAAGRVHLSNVRVTDKPQCSPECAAFCADGPASRLTLSNCVVEESCEVGVLAVGEGSCIIESCHFRRLGKQAVEVREMGQVEIRGSTFQQVWQGVSAYAGARRVSMENVVIDGASNEGVMATGDLQNSETQQLGQLHGRSEAAVGAGRSGRLEAKKIAQQVTELAKERADQLDWTGRLVLTMSHCTIKNARGVACSMDEGCAAVLTSCTFEKSAVGTSNSFPGVGVLIKGGSDATVSRCRMLRNMIGLSVGFNYDGKVIVEDSIFSGNRMKDILDQSTMLKQMPTKLLEGKVPESEMQKILAEREMHEKAGAWSAAKPITELRNQFLSNSQRIPEIEELGASSLNPLEPLPQKLAWEAAARGNYSLARPCLCGFSFTELGNSPECHQVGLGNHIDFPPLMCLPCSESLASKQDDANAQFYFSDEAEGFLSTVLGSLSPFASSSLPFRHWCLLGEVVSVDAARGADAHSFMAFRGNDAAKQIKLRSKFAGAEADVEVLLMLDEPLAKGSGSMESGCTLAILYAELEDIDITRGTGEVVVKDNSLIYVFGAPLEQVVTHAASVAVKDGDSRLCGHCGEDASSAAQRCDGCGLVAYCSDKCYGSHRDLHSKLCPQMAMLQQLASADFRLYRSRFDFTEWAAGLPEWVPPQADLQHVGPPDAEVKPGSAEPRPMRSADEWCELLDIAMTKGEVEKVLAEIEEALQLKKSDGSFVFSKSNGRQKLQNKLKRAKARSTAGPLEVKEPEPEREMLEVANLKTAVEDAEAGDQESEAVQIVSNLGQMDDDGYHGISDLPWSPLLPWKCWEKCKKSCHVFVCRPGTWPCSWPCPDNEGWCVSMKPRAFCSDFREVMCHEKTRVLSCWGHSDRPGHEIPSMGGSSQRLWKIRPSDISCSQDSIKNEFSDGHSLDETLAKLRSGQCRVEDIEKIQITWHSHRKTSPGHARWWTYTGNRRLSLFQKLEKEGCLPFIVAQWVNTPVPWWRMTTHQAGDQPRVRGSRGSK